MIVNRPDILQREDSPILDVFINKDFLLNLSIVSLFCNNKAFLAAVVQETVRGQKGPRMHNSDARSDESLCGKLNSLLENMKKWQTLPLVKILTKI